jgi:hypothetical protein
MLKHFTIIFSERPSFSAKPHEMFFFPLQLKTTSDKINKIQSPQGSEAIPVLQSPVRHLQEHSRPCMGLCCNL